MSKPVLVGHHAIAFRIVNWQTTLIAKIDMPGTPFGLDMAQALINGLRSSPSCQNNAKSALSGNSLGRYTLDAFSSSLAKQCGIRIFMPYAELGKHHKTSIFSELMEGESKASGKTVNTAKIYNKRQQFQTYAADRIRTSRLNTTQALAQFLHHAPGEPPPLQPVDRLARP